jgi:hypothetical protein
LDAAPVRPVRTVSVPSSGPSVWRPGGIGIERGRRQSE